MGWKYIPTFLESVLLTLWRSAKPGGYWTVRRGRRFGDVASIGLPITNHPFDALRLLRAGLSPLTFHVSPIPSPSHFSLITAASAAQQRFQDLFLILSQRINLGLFSITAAFSHARAHRALRSRPRPRIRPREVMEYWSVECCANSELRPRSGLEMLKKILGSGFKISGTVNLESLGPHCCPK